MERLAIVVVFLMAGTTCGQAQTVDCSQISNARWQLACEGHNVEVRQLEREAKERRDQDAKELADRAKVNAERVLTNAIANNCEGNDLSGPQVRELLKRGCTVVYNNDLMNNKRFMHKLER